MRKCYFIRRIQRRSVQLRAHRVTHVVHSVHGSLSGNFVRTRFPYIQSRDMHDAKIRHVSTSVNLPRVTGESVRGCVVASRSSVGIRRTRVKEDWPIFFFMSCELFLASCTSWTWQTRCRHPRLAAQTVAGSPGIALLHAYHANPA